MKKLLMAAVATVVISGAAAVPASAAVTYNLGADFGNAVFKYGTVSPTNVFTPFSLSDCSAIGATGPCYRGTDTYQVEFQKNGTDLLVHPGPNDGQNSFLLFTAPVTGVYKYDVVLSRQDSGDGVNVFTYNSNDAGLTSVGTIDAANPLFPVSYSQFLSAGQTVGIGIDRGGTANNYFNDSTYFTGTITSPVPEPATWALMISGFGLVGGVMRRRNRQVTTTVRHA